MSWPRPSRLNVVLSLLLGACIVRMWLVPVSSSLWVDELVTTFVVRFPKHWSYAVAPQVTESIFYLLARTSTSVFGQAEAVWRLPSILAMAAALWLVALLARRLIHPQAGWFAAFACLALHGVNYYAIDARPYALGMAVSAASVLFLVRWFDRGRWLDALLFALFAALLWRVHLLYWPFYAVYAVYAAARTIRRDTPARIWQIAAIAVLVSIAIAPVALRALSMLAEASTHVFAPVPGFNTFQHIVHWNLVAICGAGAWLLARMERAKPAVRAASAASLILIGAWWLACPVILYLYSLATHNVVLVQRYSSLLLPGAGMAATALAALSLPENCWKQAAIGMGIAALIFQGNWSAWRPRHDNSDWRGAAAEVNRLASPETPVILPSPFIEARGERWSPDYPLPGFLYCHLLYYPVRGNLNLFPFDRAPEGIPWAEKLLSAKLAPSGRFLIYGPAGGAGYWYDWFYARPELAGWSKRMEKFGDVFVALFADKSHLTPSPESSPSLRQSR